MNPLHSVPAENPRLKMALREIEEVMQKHDVAGVCVVQVPGSAQFFVKVDPSHSLAYLNGKTLELRQPIIPLVSDAEATQAYRQKIADTLNMVVNLQLLCMQLASAMSDAQVKVRQTFNLFPPQGPSANGHRPEKK